MILKQIVKNKSFGSALLKSCNLKIYKDLYILNVYFENKVVISNHRKMDAYFKIDDFESQITNFTKCLISFFKIMFSDCTF
jgi:hypothetical protein